MNLRKDHYRGVLSGNLGVCTVPPAGEPGLVAASVWLLAVCWLGKRQVCKNLRLPGRASGHLSGQGFTWASFIGWVQRVAVGSPVWEGEVMKVGESCRFCVVLLESAKAAFPAPRFFLFGFGFCGVWA